MTTRYIRSIWWGSSPTSVASSRSRTSKLSSRSRSRNGLGARQLGGRDLLDDLQALGEQRDDLAIDRLDAFAEGQRSGADMCTLY